MSKIDPLTRLSWNNGIVGVSQQPGTMQIQEDIGGDNVSDYASFSLKRRTTLKIDTDGAIAQLIRQKAVVASSNDSYSSSMTVTLWAAFCVGE